MQSGQMRINGERAVRRNVIVASKKKIVNIDITKQGVERVKEKDAAVYANLAGRANKMKDKNWVDPSGKKGKGIGLYRFEKKYGTNVDGYSPIYTPDIWAESGESYQLGTGGLLAWAAILFILLSVGYNLIISTSQI